MIGIYKITNPKGKIYIGQSIDIDDRCRRYRQGHCKGQKYLYASIIKYGWFNHKFEILETCSPEELNNLEIKYIAEYDSTNRNIGMNLSLGGQNSRHSEESKELIRKNSPRRVEFYAERNGVVIKFNSMNEAEKTLGVTRKSIRESLKNPDLKFGKYSYSYEYPATISNNKRTRTQSEEARNKMSQNSGNVKAIIAEKDGEIFNFRSITEASKTLGDSKKVIWFALNNPTKTKSKYKYSLQKK